MSNNIDQENPSANDDNTDATDDRGENDYFQCTSCKVRSFFTYRGLNQHLRICLRKTRDVIVTDSQPASPISTNDLQSTTESQQRQNARRLSVTNTQTSNGENGTCVRYLKRFKMHMNVLPFGKNFFMLPTGAAAKKYITETTKLMNGWTNNSPLKDIAFKAIPIMPSLLLQKQSKTSKAKDRLKALERRIDL